MAAMAAGLAVVVRDGPAPLGRSPAETMDVPAGALPPEDIPAIVWRAIAHGAREIAFDPERRDGTGLTDARGRTAGWIGPALTVARQLRFNARLFEALQPGPAVRVAVPAPRGFDVVLLQDARSWVLAATNTAARPVRAVVDLPAPVPPAMWVNLLDGTAMSMLGRPAGPRWTVTLERGGARFDVIDKAPKAAAVAGATVDSRWSRCFPPVFPSAWRPMR
jgi:hypothetical protein